MASEVIKLNLIPSGEMPTYHCSQFDNGREIKIELYNGEDAYTLPTGYTAELHTRKMDNNIVTLSSTSVVSNLVTFTSTEQLTACAGNNLSEVSIKDASDYVVGTLNFWLYVEKDPLQGGLTSTSAIHDLTEQIEEITTEIVGENYYNKSETDDLLDLKADKSTTYTKTETDTLLTAKADKTSVYTKTETNSLLAEKADTDDVYTKSQVETKLAAKADANTVYTKSETDTLLSAKADANGVYNKVEVDAMVDDLEDAIDLKADAATTYTKTQVDTALALKADAATTYTKTEVDTALALKANAADVYTKSEVYNKTETYTQAQVNALIDNIFPTLTASGSIANFITALSKPLVSVTAAAGATTVTRCGVNVLQLTDSTTTASGLTCIVKSDNTVEVQDTATAVQNFMIYEGPLKAGSYILSGCVGGSGSTYRIRIRDKNNTSNEVNSTDGDSSVFTILNDTTVQVQIFIYTDVTMNKTFNVMLRMSTSPSTFYPYNGQTVPVADATTLITQSGVNNVFADSGEVTVQYKYMSM